MNILHLQGKNVLYDNFTHHIILWTLLLQHHFQLLWASSNHNSIKFNPTNLLMMKKSERCYLMRFLRKFLMRISIKSSLVKIKSFLNKGNSLKKIFLSSLNKKFLNLVRLWKNYRKKSMKNTYIHNLLLLEFLTQKQ